MFHFALGIGHAQVVVFLHGIDFDQCFIVEQQFRDQRSAGGVGKVAVPAGACLIPDLDDLQIQCGSGDLVALGIFQIGGSQNHFLRGFVRLDHEGCRFKFPLRRHKAENAGFDAVGWFRGGKTLHAAHGRDHGIFHVLRRSRTCQQSGEHRHAQHFPFHVLVFLSVA